MSLPSLLPFLSLPRELRDQIYTHALSYPNLHAVFTSMRIECSRLEATQEATRLPLSSFPTPRVPHLTTPSLLLLNRQITREALATLSGKTFTLSETPPYSAQLGRPLDLSSFVAEEVLKRVRHMRIEIDMGRVGNGRDWAKTVEGLVDIWCVGCELETLEVVVVGKMEGGDGTFGGADRARNVRGVLNRLWNLGSQAKVTFVGDVPEFRTPKRQAVQGEWYDVVD